MMVLHCTHDFDAENRKRQMKFMTQHFDSEIFYIYQSLLTMLCGKPLKASQHAGFLRTQGGTLRKLARGG
jgi:hypothetical protein